MPELGTTDRLMSIHDFQQALIEALGLKGHWITKIEFETDAVTAEVRIRTEEILREEQAATLKRMFLMTHWVPEPKKGNDG